MKIISISFSGSNPSLGPHNSKSSKTLAMAKYQNELKDLLENSTVNGSVTMGEYIKLRLDKNMAELEKIHNAFASSDLNSGERIIDLNFSLEDGSGVSLNDLRKYSITGNGYTNFSNLMKEKGKASKQSSFFDLKEKPKTSKEFRPEISRSKSDKKE